MKPATHSESAVIPQCTKNSVMLFAVESQSGLNFVNIYLEKSQFIERRILPAFYAAITTILDFFSNIS